MPVTTTSPLIAYHGDPRIKTGILAAPNATIPKIAEVHRRYIGAAE